MQVVGQSLSNCLLFGLSVCLSWRDSCSPGLRRDGALCPCTGPACELCRAPWPGALPCLSVSHVQVPPLSPSRRWHVWPSACLIIGKWHGQSRTVTVALRACAGTGPSGCLLFSLSVCLIIGTWYGQSRSTVTVVRRACAGTGPCPAGPVPVQAQLASCAGPPGRGPCLVCLSVTFSFLRR